MRQDNSLSLYFLFQLTIKILASLYQAKFSTFQVSKVIQVASQFSGFYQLSKKQVIYISIKEFKYINQAYLSNIQGSATSANSRNDRGSSPSASTPYKRLKFRLIQSSPSINWFYDIPTPSIQGYQASSQLSSSQLQSLQVTNSQVTTISNNTILIISISLSFPILQLQSLANSIESDTSSKPQPYATQPQPKQVLGSLPKQPLK